MPDHRCLGCKAKFTTQKGLSAHTSQCRSYENRYKNRELHRKKINTPEEIQDSLVAGPSNDFPDDVPHYPTEDVS